MLQKIILVAFVVLLCQCKVREIPEVVPYTFHNKTGQRVIVDRYASQADYRDMANRLGRDTIEPAQSRDLPMPTSSTIWIDWYTEDLSTSNWMALTGRMLGNLVYLPRISIGADPSQVDLLRGRPGVDTSRSIFLNGTSRSTSWQVIVPPNYEGAGTHDFTFYRDFSGVHKFTNLSGTIKESPISFTIDASGYQPYEFEAFAIVEEQKGFYRSLFRVAFNPLNNTRDKLRCDLMTQNGAQYGPFDMVRK